jgi:hypothetical protein
MFPRRGRVGEWDDPGTLGAWRIFDGSERVIARSDTKVGIVDRDMPLYISGIQNADGVVERLIVPPVLHPDRPITLHQAIELGLAFLELVRGPENGRAGRAAVRGVRPGGDDHAMKRRMAARALAAQFCAPATAHADPTPQPSPGYVIQAPTGPTVGGLRSLPPICGVQPRARAGNWNPDTGAWNFPGTESP